MTSHDKRKILSEEEVQKLLSYINSQADSARRKGSSRAVIDEIIILLLIDAGLRSDELCKLRIKDLPMIHGENSIWIHNAGEVVREISIPSELSDLLRRFVILYRKQAQPQDPLLQSERGNSFSYLSLYNKVCGIGKNSGLGKLSPAVLRHTYIKRLYDVEQDLRYVQEQAGYRNCRTIAKYVRIDQIDKDLRMTNTCHACGKIIKKGKGKTIESGQFLCDDCLSYF